MGGSAATGAPEALLDEGGASQGTLRPLRAMSYRESNCCRNQPGAPASELSHVDCWGQPRHDREHERAFFPSRRAYHSE